MSKPFTIDATNFNRAVSQLSKLTGKDFNTVLRFEASKVLEAASKYTKAAKRQQVIEAARGYYGSRQFFKGGNITINNGKKKAGTEGRIWVIKNGKKYSLNWKYRFNDKLWIELLSKYREAMEGTTDAKYVEKKVKAFIRAKSRAVNLGKQSFGMLAERANKAYAMPSAQAKADARRGSDNRPELYQFFKPTQNISYFETNEGAKFVITAINRSKAANNRNAQGGLALQKAMNGRAKFFEMNLKKGLFNNIEQATKRYGFYTA